jgi:hypothetical protein
MIVVTSPQLTLTLRSERKEKINSIGADESERNAHSCPRNEESSGIGLRDERGVFSLNAATGSATLKKFGKGTEIGVVLCFEGDFPFAGRVGFCYITIGHPQHLINFDSRDGVSGFPNLLSVVGSSPTRSSFMEVPHGQQLGERRPWF